MARLGLTPTDNTFDEQGTVPVNATPLIEQLWLAAAPTLPVWAALSAGCGCGWLCLPTTLRPAAP